MGYYFLNFFPFLGEVSYIYAAIAVSLIFLRKKSKEITFVISMFIFFSLMYLPFLTESRMAILSSAFLIILVAFVLGTTKNKVVLFSILTVVSLWLVASLFFTHQEINNKTSFLLETEIPTKIAKQIPPNCFLIAEYTTIINSISKTKTTSPLAVLENKEFAKKLGSEACLYHLYDSYCTSSLISYGINARKHCQKILDFYDKEVVAEYKKGKTKYFLFKLTSKS